MKTDNENIGPLLMDIISPDVNGYEALQRLKNSDPNYQSLPLPLLPIRKKKTVSLQSECDDYLA